jgi:hypothetical protein
MRLITTARRTTTLKEPGYDYFAGMRELAITKDQHREDDLLEGRFFLAC